MNETVRLLVKSFYEDEWKWFYDAFCGHSWLRVKDKPGDTFVLEMKSRHRVAAKQGNNLFIPWYLRGYVARQAIKGQDLLARKKWFGEGVK